MYHHDITRPLQQLINHKKNIEFLKIVDRVYKSIRVVKISEKPEGKLVINDEGNGVLM